MLDAAFDRMAQTFFDGGSYGTLDIEMPDGRRLRLGRNDPVLGVTITDPKVPGAILRNPELGLGEAYMEGTLRIENDDLRTFMGILLVNLNQGRKHWSYALRNAVTRRLRFIGQANVIGRAQRNVAHHYDLSGALYDLFLDEDRQYSCAYWPSADITLGEAQRLKKAHIAKKLLIEPGMEVLDIGCGWGGMALTLARDYGARVTGVTLSREQHAIAERRAKEAGLEDKVTFRLMDYRNVEQTFDRIVSVGMFEHVGLPHFGEYFAKVGALLDRHGVALIHTIGRTGPPGITSPFIAKYIFPGGYVPAMSEMAAAWEPHLYATDLEVWRLHYAKTLREWERRFSERWDEAAQLYDERFCRMWKYYLIGAEQTFVHGRQSVFQAQLAHRKDAVPITRDYLYG